jgi:ribonuclease R
MNEFAQKLLEVRRSKGALAIYDIKKGIYTNEEGIILPLSKELAHQSNIVVQEFMIICNKGLAMFCANNNLPLLYRNHTARLNTPDRKTILEQISTVLEEPQHLTALKERSYLWFERANYSPSILGHYGLNEPAYTHATSPIRRIADLINHQLIKSFLKKSSKAYTQEELLSLSDEINKAKLEISEHKAESFKEKAIMALSLKLNSATSDELIAMDNGQFESILDRAVKSGLLFPNMIEALKSRFENNNIDVIMLYDILFKNPELKDEWIAFIIMALDYAYQTPGIPISLINLSAQKGFLEDFDTVVNPTVSGFSALSKVIYNGKLIQPEKPSISVKKKEAVSRSAGRLLFQILDIPFTEQEKDIEKTIETKELDKTEKNDGTNYVGILLEKVTKNKSWGNPEFTFQVIGASHNPTINCKGEIEIDHNLISVYATSNNKKEAKHLAAKKMLKIIKDTVPEDITEVIQPDETGIVLNYVGMLQEFCMQNKIPVPDYIINQRIEKKSLVFDCDLQFNYNETNYHWSGCGLNKKEAKYIVAEKAYNEFLKIKLNTK